MWNRQLNYKPFIDLPKKYLYYIHYIIKSPVAVAHIEEKYPVSMKSSLS